MITTQKFIFIVGGVISGLGKGLITASIGRILKEGGYQVFITKCDPYLNVDPGTIHPIEHGEVFVTADGAETDLDLGHYERFVDFETNHFSNITSGNIYRNIIKKERKGVYQGQTIQMNPHVIDYIKNFLSNINAEADFILVEIGGVVGDIESLPFIEAIRQLRLEFGSSQVMIVMIGFLVNLKHVGELKTKPFQTSVRRFLELGIPPDLVIVRSEISPSQELLAKLSLYCGLNQKNIFIAQDQKWVYNLPDVLCAQKLDQAILTHFQLPNKSIVLKEWSGFLIQLHKNPLHVLKIALVGKYVQLHDAYLSVQCALEAAGIALNIKIEIIWIDAEQLVSETVTDKLLKTCHGVIVPGGFGERGASSIMLVARYARIKQIPYLGICLGMQLAVIEFMRSVCGLTEADSQEFNINTSTPLFIIMPHHLDYELGGTLRLGDDQIDILPGSLANRLYNTTIITERHRHRYEFNNQYLDILEKHQVIVSGTTVKKKLVEIIEFKNHPFFVGCQFHPEFRSRPNKPHPLFLGFIKTTLAYHQKNY